MKKGAQALQGLRAKQSQSVQPVLRTAAAALNPSRQIQVKIKEEKENKFWFKTCTENCKNNLLAAQ